MTASWQDVARQFVQRLAETPVGVGLTPLQSVAAPVLAALSGGFGFLHRARRGLYAFGVLKAQRLPVPVISVGNVTWGGSGKTPMTLLVAQRCLALGVAPLILTRGYRGGDEARLLDARLSGTGALIAVGADRARAARAAIAANPKPPIGVAILDDGMQHLPVAREIEIVMVNTLTLWGSGRLVPRGPLRERPEDALARADIAVLHNWDVAPQPRRAQAAAEVQAHLRPGTPLLRSSLRVIGLLPVLGGGGGSLGEAQPTDTIRGARVVCMTGVGCPEAVEATLREMGAAEVELLAFSDHHCFTEQELRRAVERAGWPAEGGGAREQASSGILILTEKDFLRQPKELSQWLTVVRPPPWADQPATGVRAFVLRAELALSGTEPELALMSSAAAAGQGFGEAETAVVSCSPRAGAAAAEAVLDAVLRRVLVG